MSAVLRIELTNKQLAHIALMVDVTGDSFEGCIVALIDDSISAEEADRKDAWNSPASSSDPVAFSGVDKLFSEANRLFGLSEERRSAAPYSPFDCISVNSYHEADSLFR